MRVRERATKLHVRVLGRDLYRLSPSLSMLIRFSTYNTRLHARTCAYDEAKLDRIETLLSI